MILALLRPPSAFSLQMRGQPLPGPEGGRVDAIASYLEEPWYEILLEWDEIEIEDDLEAECDLEKNSCSVDVLVKRSEDDSWTIVNWTLSRHNGRWLTDSLSIN